MLLAYRCIEKFIFMTALLTFCVVSSVLDSVTFNYIPQLYRLNFRELTSYGKMELDFIH